MSFPIEIRSSGVEGSALFATKFIPQGTLIFSEPVLFSIPLDALSRENGAAIQSRADAMLAMQDCPAEAIADALREAKLQDAQLEVFRKSPGRDDLQKFQIISYDMCPTWSQTPVGFGYGVYGSYLNHSCRPNAIYFWDEEKEEMQVRTLRDIDDGEEFSIDYLATEEWLTREERRNKLKLLLKLDECQCELCGEGTASDSDERVRWIRDAERRLVERVKSEGIIAAGSSPAKREDSQGISEHLINVAITELGGLKDNQTVPRYLDPRLANAYLVASHAMATTQDLKAHAACVNKAQEVHDLCFGHRNLNVKASQIRVAQRIIG